jgi:PAS domain S-box-containing protein
LIRAAGENGYRDFLNKEMDVSIRRPDGEIRSINMISFLTETHRGKMFGTMVRDVTERKRAEEALRESEEKFRAIFEQAAVGIAYVGLDGQFVGVNNKYCDITGYSRDEMLRIKYPDITYADDHGLDEMIRNDLIGRISTRRMVEKRYVRKDGSLVWVSLTVSLVKDADGQPKYFIAVAENIAERKRLEGDLLRAYDSLKEEYERRIDFTNAAAHELRTPLTPIIGYTDILKSEVKDERHLRFLEIIERNALRQKTLVNRMLELASLDAGMAHVRNTEFPLRPLVAEIADNYRAVNPNIRVEVPAEMRAETDPDILRHVLDNLVSNAVKYSDSDKEIEIRVSEAGDSYQFSVKDHGAGIPREEWVKIFERFYIVGGDTDSRTCGRSGLGLALVRAYIRLIGGHVWLESEPGRGSTFFFTVPRKPGR